MTIRWQVGKEPTKADIKGVITNAISKFIEPSDVDKIAEAIVKFYRGRIEGRK